MKARRTLLPVLRGKEDRSMDIEIAAERGVLPMFSGTQDAKRYRKHFLEHRAGAIDVDCRELAHLEERLLDTQKVKSSILLLPTKERKLI